MPRSVSTEKSQRATLSERRRTAHKLRQAAHYYVDCVQDHVLDAEGADFVANAERLLQDAAIRFAEVSRG